MKKQRRRAYLNIILAASTLIALLEIAAYVAVAVWSPEVNLTNHPRYDRVPSITQTRDGTMWIAWASERKYGQYDIYYTSSSDFGSTWASPIRFTWTLGTDDTPCILETSDGSIWIAWSSDMYGNSEIVYRTSSDHGSIWGPIVRLTNNPWEDNHPSVIQNIDGTLWAVWQRDESGNSTIYYKTSSDFGATWSEAANLTTKDSRWDTRPYITRTDNGTIWVVWASPRLTQWEIYYKTTSDNGLTWSNATNLTHSWYKDDMTPAILQSANGTLWVFWASGQADHEETFDIFYRTSSDYGTTWSDNATLVSRTYDDQNPAVTSTNERRIWLVWHSDIEPGDPFNYEVLYKISDEIPSVHDIAVIDIIAWGAGGAPITWVSRGIPIYINVTVENQGHFQETFNVSAYADRNAGDEHLHIDTQEDVILDASANATITLTWDTNDAPYGTYYISAEATVVPGEHDTYDNVMIHGAKIGGICVPWHPSGTNLLSLLARLASSISLIAALGAIAVAFFKTLMSVRLQWPWRQSTGQHTKTSGTPLSIPKSYGVSPRMP